MPILQDPRREAFAQAVARGVRFNDAYEDAGFAVGSSHGARLARQPEVAARISELRSNSSLLTRAPRPALIAHLLRVADLEDGSIDAASRREARLTLLEINALRKEHEVERDMDRQEMGFLSRIDENVQDS